MSTEPLTEGLHFDVPMERYIADPCVNPSISKGIIHSLISKSPAHAKYDHPRLNPDRPPDDSSRADLGSAIHSAILGGADIVYGEEEFKDWRKKAAQQFRTEARENGQIPLLYAQRPEVEMAAKEADVLLKSLPSWDGNMKTEGTMIWKDDENWKRGRFDIWMRDMDTLIDVKTTASADPSNWIRNTLFGTGYDIQAEHYTDGIVATEGLKKRPKFLFLLVEIKPPFCCSLVGLDPAFSDLARRKVKKGTEIWQECMERNYWPGYSQMPHWAELPGWHEADVMSRMEYAEEAMKK